MPPPDNGPMDLGRYLSVLGPFEIFTTLLILIGIIYLAGLSMDLVVRARLKEGP